LKPRNRTAVLVGVGIVISAGLAVLNLFTLVLSTRWLSLPLLVGAVFGVNALRILIDRN